jgi:hypothetical protein
VLQGLIVEFGLLNLWEELLEGLELEQLRNGLKWLETNKCLEGPEGQRNLRLVVRVGKLIGILLMELRGEVLVLEKSLAMQ